MYRIELYFTVHERWIEFNLTFKKKAIKMLESNILMLGTSKSFFSSGHFNPYRSWISERIINNSYTNRGKFFSSLKKYIFFGTHTTEPLARSWGIWAKLHLIKQSSQLLCLIFIIYDKHSLLFNMNRRKQACHKTVENFFFLLRLFCTLIITGESWKIRLLAILWVLQTFKLSKWA